MEDPQPSERGFPGREIDLVDDENDLALKKFLE
jgi:hypothetical protein